MFDVLIALLVVNIADNSTSRVNTRKFVGPLHKYTPVKRLPMYGFLMD